MPQIPERHNGRANAVHEEHALPVLGTPLVHADRAVRRRDVAGSRERVLGRIRRISESGL
ncbi:hypothetical protein RRF57_011537 [Xylaria bambusicola]|uniref:Uncharacterized protein n=1 Tax=Xylaria bambusicola TaxID=326684 RepID=A0AAN7ZD85_9PEZI